MPRTPEEESSSAYLPGSCITFPEPTGAPESVIGEIPAVEPIWANRSPSASTVPPEVTNWYQPIRTTPRPNRIVRSTSSDILQYRDNHVEFSGMFQLYIPGRWDYLTGPFLLQTTAEDHIQPTYLQAIRHALELLRNPLANLEVRKIVHKPTTVALANLEPRRGPTLTAILENRWQYALVATSFFGGLYNLTRKKLLDRYKMQEFSYEQFVEAACDEIRHTAKKEGLRYGTRYYNPYYLCSLDLDQLKKLRDRKETKDRSNKTYPLIAGFGNLIDALIEKFPVPPKLSMPDTAPVPAAVLAS